MVVFALGDSKKNYFWPTIRFELCIHALVNNQYIL